jgi:hypothetical protein
MGTVSAYILMITLFSLEVFAFVKKEYTWKFWGVNLLAYVVLMLMIFASNVEYFMILIYMIETILLFVLLFRVIFEQFRDLDTDDE